MFRSIDVNHKTFDKRYSKLIFIFLINLKRFWSMCCFLLFHKSCSSFPYYQHKSNKQCWLVLMTSQLTLERGCEGNSSEGAEQQHNTSKKHKKQHLTTSPMQNCQADLTAACLNAASLCNEVEQQERGDIFMACGNVHLKLTALK